MTKILLIDDDEIVCNGLKLFLDRSGFDVITTNNGKTAYQIFNLEKCDVVITDIFMPLMDGLTLIQKLKRCNDQVKIIAISGGGSLGSHYYLKHAQFFGAKQILKKPIDPDELIKTINAVMVM